MKITFTVLCELYIDSPISLMEHTHMQPGLLCNVLCMFDDHLSIGSVDHPKVTKK